jgi:hypothetical protein
MTGKSNTGRMAAASFMLAVALCLPAAGQHRNNDHPAPRPPAPPREVAPPPRQAPPATRENPGSFRGGMQQRPQQQFGGYTQPPSRGVAHPPAESERNSRSGGTSSFAGEQQRNVPRPPERSQPRTEEPNARFGQGKGEVAHPPAPTPHGENPGAFASGQGREVPRPPQANSQAREVPRPPQAGQRHGGDWLRSHQSLSFADQQKALQNDPQFRKLPPQQQQRLVNRLQNFNNLPPQEQQRRLNRIETWEHLTPQQKQQARQLAGQWKQLPPDRQKMMKTAIGDLRAMPPDQRERILESDRFKGMFSDQERNMLRQTTKLPLAPAQPPHE